MRHFVICTLQIFGDQIRKNEMGGACSTYGEEEQCILYLDGETCGKESIQKTQAYMVG